MMNKYPLNRILLAFWLAACPWVSGADEIEAGDKAPRCRLAPLEGGEARTLEDYRGKVVYLDFWASWCGPCAQSFPFMNQLHKEFAGRGLEVLGVNLDEESSEARAFLDRVPAQFRIVTNEDGQCPHEFGVKAMPSTYLIDQSGTVRRVHLGFKLGESAQLREQVEQLLASP